ncbi:PQQ-dependent sugar dehydrogenase [Alphaproteobacteria bacterium]|nr:PQQ-dependent sugar dehydrogenase [Alphaproteobacteria bacterium]
MINFIFFLILNIFIILQLEAKIKINKLLDLNEPWSLTFIDEKNILITEKEGNIILFNNDKKEIKKIPHNLKIYNKGQGGLLDIIYKDETIWVSYSESLKNSLSRTSVAKSKFNYKKLVFKNIFTAFPPINSGYHFGSRLAFKEDYLFVSLGDRGKGMIAQDPKKHPGSIVRIFGDGSIPSDNPGLINKNNWLKEVYQIGLRNPQGLELSPFDNEIYVTNHGAKGGDFFGKVYYQGNYGWKIVGWGGKNYIGTKIGPKWKEGFNKPIHYWTPSIGVSSFKIYKGKEFSELNGMAIIGSLKFQNLYILKFSKLATTPQLSLFVEKKLGRIRDIEINPKNGKIYIASNNSLWIIEK